MCIDKVYLTQQLQEVVNESTSRFLDNIEQQLKQNKELSTKQKETVNKIYKQNKQKLIKNLVKKAYKIMFKTKKIHLNIEPIIKAVGEKTSTQIILNDLYEYLPKTSDYRERYINELMEQYYYKTFGLGSRNNKNIENDIKTLNMICDKFSLDLSEEIKKRVVYK